MVVIRVKSNEHLIIFLRKLIYETNSILYTIGFTENIDHDLLRKYYEEIGIFRFISNETHIKQTIDTIVDHFDVRIQKSILKVNDIQCDVILRNNFAIVDLIEIKDPINTVWLDSIKLKIIREEYTQEINTKIIENKWEHKIKNIIGMKNKGISIKQIMDYNEEHKILENNNNNDNNNIILDGIDLSTFEKIINIIDNNTKIHDVVNEDSKNINKIVNATLDLGLSVMSFDIIDECIIAEKKIIIPDNKDIVYHILDKQCQIENKTPYVKELIGSIKNNKTTQHWIRVKELKFNNIGPLYEEMKCLFGNVNIQTQKKLFEQPKSIKINKTAIDVKGDVKSRIKELFEQPKNIKINKTAIDVKGDVS
jgi:hypothetical protein